MSKKKHTGDREVRGLLQIRFSRQILWVLASYIFACNSTLTFADENFARANSASQIAPVISVSPRNDLIAISRCNEICGIDEINLKTGERRFLRTANRSIQAPYFFPDGKRLVVLLSEGKASSLKRSIAVIDLEQRSIRQVTSGEEYDFSPSVSSDGQSIVFARAGRLAATGRVPAKDFDIFSIPLSGDNKVKQLSHVASRVMSRPVKFDEVLYYSTTDSITERIYSYEISPRKLREITPSNSGFTLQGGIFESRRLVAVKWGKSDYSVVVLALDGSVLDEFRDDFYIARASLTTDAGPLAYVRRRQGNLELVLVDVKTRKQLLSIDINGRATSEVILEVQK